MKVLNIVTAVVLDVLNPQRCCCCEEPLSHVHNGICIYCLDRITTGSGYSNIIRKGVPDHHSMDNRKWYLDECVPIHDYNDEMKKVIQSIKYERRISLVPVMSKIANMVLSEKGWEIDFIVPVPMKRAKKTKRGFNQAETLAKGIGRLSGIPVNSLLKEKGNAKTQKSLQISERFVNVLGRFTLKCKNAEISGMRILLVDDDYTTGATLNECARLLKEKGASRVMAVTLAGTPGKKD